MNNDSGTFHYPKGSLDAVLAAISQVCSQWGSEEVQDPSPKNLRVLNLPVLAGLRMGKLRIELAINPDGSSIDWQVTDAIYRFHRQGLVAVAFGAAGGLVAMLWPFFPRLLPLAALGLVLAVVAWMMVGSRVHYRDVIAFWQEVHDLVTEPPPSADPNGGG